MVFITVGFRLFSLIFKNNAFLKLNNLRSVSPHRIPTIVVLLPGLQILKLIKIQLKKRYLLGRPAMDIQLKKTDGL